MPSTCYPCNLNIFSYLCSLRLKSNYALAPNLEEFRNLFSQNFEINKIPHIISWDMSNEVDSMSLPILSLFKLHFSR